MRVYLFQVIIYTIITTIMMAILLELFFFSGLELQLLFLLLIFASPVLMCVCVCCDSHQSSIETFSIQMALDL